MSIGVIVRVFADRSYGFVVDEEDGSEHFFHRSDWIDSGEPIRNTKVVFEFGKYRGRSKATNLRRVTVDTLNQTAVQS
jgi:cold shock CspA family protein